MRNRIQVGRQSRAATFAVVVALVALPAPLAAAPITFDVSFALSGGAPPVPSGSITFDDSDPLFGTSAVLFASLTTPYSFSFTEGTRVWTEADPFDLFFLAPTAYFSSGQLVGLQFRVYDTELPGDTERPLFFTYSSGFRIWRTEPNSGTYSLEPAETAVVPEPTTLLLLGGGLAGAAVRRARRRS